MIKNQDINIKFDLAESESDLSPKEQELLKLADKTADSAYAPYSNFHVGAAILLENGEIITGNNQENAAYPSGICAERVAIFSAGALYPKEAVKTLVVVAKNFKNPLTKPVTPCGGCRQVIAEYESKNDKKIKIIMRGQTGPILICYSIESLLPLMFNSKFLSQE